MSYTLPEALPLGLVDYWNRDGLTAVLAQLVDMANDRAAEANEDAEHARTTGADSKDVRHAMRRETYWSRVADRIETARRRHVLGYRMRGKDARLFAHLAECMRRDLSVSVAKREKWHSPNVWRLTHASAWLLTVDVYGLPCDGMDHVGRIMAGAAPKRPTVEEDARSLGQLAFRGSLSFAGA